MKPWLLASDDQPLPWSCSSAVWVQPCSATTNDALGGRCSGAWTNIRRLPGFAPNRVSSRRRVAGRGDVTGARDAFFRADARRLRISFETTEDGEELLESRALHGLYCVAPYRC